MNISFMKSLVAKNYRLLMTAAAYFAGGFLGLQIPYIGSQITLIWPPTGIALAALLFWGRGIIPGIWLGAFLVNLATGTSWAVALAISIGNTIGPIVSWLLLHHAGFHLRMEKRRDILIFVLAGAVLPMTITATIGSLTLIISGMLPLAQGSAAWFGWWWGDLLGVLLFTPPLICFDRDTFRKVWADPQMRRETLLPMVLLTASGMLVFLIPAHVGLPRQIDLLPAIFLIWLAAIRDIWFASLSMLIIGAIAILSTALGYGPFIGGNVHANLLWLWVYLAGFAISGLFVAAISSGYGRAREELLLSRERMELALKGGDLGYWDIDLLSNRMVVNERWAEMLETSLAEVTPSTREVWLASLHPEDREHVLAVGEAYRKGRLEHYEVKYRMVTRKGNVRWQVTRGAAIKRDQNGQATHMVGTVMDVTAAQEAMQALIAAKEQAEAADNIKSAFLASMSHELRTPLNSIIGFTGIILKGIAGPLNDEQKKQLNMVRNSAQHLLSLINDVLDISKIESGQLQVTCENFNLRHTIEKAVKSMRPLAVNKGLELTCNLSPEIEMFCGDQRRIEQVLLNLISNAVKFTGKGSVKIECELEGENITIRVIDTGIGIRNEDMETIFQAFRQIDSGLSRKYEGTGLGLSISKRLVGLMGGRITVASVLGAGSTFSIFLPKERKNV